MSSFHLMSASVTPVVLTSACGLVTPALYSRLGDILSRIRSFHQQKIELLKGVHEHDPDELRMLIEMLDTQIEAVVVKARLIKRGLTCLLAAIAAFLVCSLFAEAATLHDSFGTAALGTGFVGLCFFFVGLGLAMRELSLSLTPMEEERAMLKAVTAHFLAKSKSDSNIRIARRA
jgi:hypothetical protein